MAEPLTPVRPQTSWWGRNWKWVVPVGCLGLILCCIAFLGVILTIVFSAIKSSDVYEGALDRARSSEAVAAALGTPVDDGWWVSGNVDVSGPSGTADIAIPVHGPEGEGTLYAVAEKSAGRWEYSRLEVEVEGSSERIDLLEEP